MTSRSLLVAYLSFLFIALCYCILFFHMPDETQKDLSSLNPILISIPLAILAYLYQLRSSQVSRIDALVREYQSILSEVGSWLSSKGAVVTEGDHILFNKWYAQLSGVSAVVKSVLGRESKSSGTVFTLKEAFNQMRGCPIGNSWREDKLTNIFEHEIYDAFNSVEIFIEELYR